ncbi:alpha/beta hydrolase [Microbacterium sp. zg.B48]|uniref:alpha/beta fold hydrolase n=1 Tax=unclassified Microbacterium TaxID=2609290 RepID=UPI00214C691E|nr:MULTISPECIES: alpha/beta hydrolase [unclassified Microbacterium]MCR2763335.1 alpha/beta hydrolase [Microbacterium sp. zg.B48]MCR2809058.1 alpha/beta hydrolase [Microbacterium sp. zg.B185]WIM20214.1 alpha/beta hydrolase [Microbacterium sp. zg-B185]
MKTSSERSERVDTRLGSLAVRRVGAGDMTVLWSSMFVDSHTWDVVLPLLLAGAPEREFVLIDPPGLGLSDALTRRSSIAEAADAARDALAGLGATTPVDWVGNAFGGHIGYQLATDPSIIRSFVAISAPTEPIPAHLRRQIAVLHPVLRCFGAIRPVRAAVISAMLTDASAAIPGIRDVIVESLNRPTRASMSYALRAFIIDRTDVTDRLSGIGVPSLFIASDDRGDWSPEDAVRAAASVPHARSVTVTRARTLIPLEQPDALAQAILTFWAATGA